MFRIYKRLPSGKSRIAFLTLFIAGSLNGALLQAQCTSPGSTTGSTGCVTFTYKGQTVTYTTVRAADGNIWLQQNLGGAVATAKNDTLAYGDCFQWGRWDDGHQARNAATGPAPAINNPSGLGTGSPLFVVGSATAAWWNGGQLSDTWDATATATQGIDPCKSIGAGWRLPTQPEWADVVTDEAITNPDLAFSSNLKLSVGGSRSSLSGNFDFVGTRGYYWSSTTSSTGGKYYYFSAAVNNPNAGNTRGGGASVRCLNTGSVAVADSVAVNTLNNVAPVISTNGGTLQLEAHIYPTLINQAVTWSVAPGTGAATINTTGLVTAQSNGTVWAKAVSVFDPTKSDSLLITISNQAVQITGIDVKTLNNIAAVINTNAGTLPMITEILPANASQDVTWSIVSGTGAATIANTGLVTAQSNGTVWAKAVSVFDPTKSDSLLITISNQAVQITGIDVKTLNNIAAVINTNAGTLPMITEILPANASQDVTWSIVSGTGAATIANTGLVTAQSNGTVWAKAVSVFDPTKSDSLLITISNQVVPITGIDVKTLNNIAAVINTNAGTLQMIAEILPANASQDVTWSIVSGTGAATITNTGLVTAQSNGTVWAKATATSNTNFSDSLQITISGQGNTSIVETAGSIGLTIYPNPTDQVLQLVITKAHPALVLRLTDLYGRIINVIPVKANELNTALALPVADWAPGIYFLSLKGEGINITQKIVKQ